MLKKPKYVGLSLILGFFVLALISNMQLFMAAENIAHKQAPLIDATMEIKAEAALFYIGLSRLPPGASSTEEQHVWDHFSRAQWFAQAMLVGGTNAEGEFVAIEKEAVRAKVRTVLGELDELANLAGEAISLPEGERTAMIDGALSTALNQVIATADAIEDDVQYENARGVDRLHMFGIVMALLLVLAGAAAVIIQVRHERQNARIIKRLYEAGAKLTKPEDGGSFHGDVANLESFAEMMTAVIDQHAANVRELEQNRVETERALADSRQARDQAEQKAAEELALKSLLRLSLLDANLENYLLEVVKKLIYDVPWLQLEPRGGVFLTQDGEQVLQLAASHNLSPELLKLCGNVPFGHCLCGRAAEQRRTQFVNHVDEKHDIRFDNMTDHGHYSVPILHGDKLLGVIMLYVEAGHLGNQAEMSFLERVADITAMGISRRRILSDLEITKHQAETANKAKSEFLSSMSHELRTPLNAILGFGQLLEYNPSEPLTNSQHDSVNQIMKGGQHLLDLINDVLDLAKIEAGKIQLSIEVVTVREVLDEALPLTQTMADDRGISITVGDGFEQDHNVRVDHTRFKQCLLNLMSNAVKYNSEHGRVSVNAEDLPSGMVRISVSDTGPGIAEDRFAELFRPFSRLDAENSEIEGTGIGLTITKELVEKMGGHLGVESAVGEGSTFWMDLPKAEVKVQVVDDKDSETSHELPRVQGSVLYVEDNPANLILMERIVEHVEGLTMISAHNAELGIELAKSEKPDLIILDINLPGMNGFEALKELRTLDCTQDTPIIALSANAMPRDIEKGLEAGFSHYLTKPIKVDEFVDVIREVIET